jgi:hypothetical protein
MAIQSLSHRDVARAFFGPPVTWPERRGRGDQRRTPVTFLAVTLYSSEMDLKLAEGPDALFDLLISNGVTEIVDPNRENLAPAL